MAKLLDKVLVVDIEATCWEKIPRGSTNEIIEISLTVLNTKTNKNEANEGIIVKPTTTTVSEFCTQLTTLTQADVDKGITFAQACGVLTNNYQSTKYTFASWGDYDRNQFKRQCEKELVPYPFSTTHLNVKNLFAIKYKLDKEVGMMEALQLSKLEHTGVHHRGFSDSLNITNLLLHLLN